MSNEDFFSSLPQHPTREEERQRERDAARTQSKIRNASGGDLFAHAFSETSTFTPYFSDYAPQNFVDDPDFVMDEETFARFSDGLPASADEHIYTAKSEAHAQAIRDHTLKTQEASQIFSEKYGTAGVMGAYIVSGFFQPEALLVNAAGAPVYKAAANAAKFTRLQRFRNVGALAAGEGAAFAAARAPGDPLMSEGDILTVGAISGVLAGGLSSLARTRIGDSSQVIDGANTRQAATEQGYRDASKGSNWWKSVFDDHEMFFEWVPDHLQSNYMDFRKAAFGVLGDTTGAQATAISGDGSINVRRVSPKPTREPIKDKFNRLATEDEANFPDSVDEGIAKHQRSARKNFRQGGMTANQQGRNKKISDTIRENVTRDKGKEAGDAAGDAYLETFERLNEALKQDRAQPKPVSGVVPPPGPRRVSPKPTRKSYGSISFIGDRFRNFKSIAFDLGDDMGMVVHHDKRVVIRDGVRTMHGALDDTGRLQIDGDSITIQEGAQASRLDTPIHPETIEAKFNKAWSDSQEVIADDVDALFNGRPDHIMRKYPKPSSREIDKADLRQHIDPDGAEVDGQGATRYPEHLGDTIRALSRKTRNIFGDAYMRRWLPERLQRFSANIDKAAVSTLRKSLTSKAALRRMEDVYEGMPEAELRSVKQGAIDLEAEEAFKEFMRDVYYRRSGGKDYIDGLTYEDIKFLADHNPESLAKLSTSALERLTRGQQKRVRKKLNAARDKVLQAEREAKQAALDSPKRSGNLIYDPKTHEIGVVTRVYKNADGEDVMDVDFGEIRGVEGDRPILTGGPDVKGADVLTPGRQRTVGQKDVEILLPPRVTKSKLKNTQVRVNDTPEITNARNFINDLKRRLRIATDKRDSLKREVAAPSESIGRSGDIRFADEALEEARRLSNDPESNVHLVYMTPDEFGSFTVPLREGTIGDKGQSVDSVRDLMEAGTKMDELPTLTVSREAASKGKPSREGAYEVTGHDGRHRVAAMDELGDGLVPVLIKGGQRIDPKTGEAVGFDLTGLLEDLDVKVLKNERGYGYGQFKDIKQTDFDFPTAKETPDAPAEGVTPIPDYEHVPPTAYKSWSDLKKARKLFQDDVWSLHPEKRNYLKAIHKLWKDGMLSDTDVELLDMALKTVNLNAHPYLVNFAVSPRQLVTGGTERTFGAARGFINPSAPGRGVGIPKTQNYRVDRKVIELSKRALMTSGRTSPAERSPLSVLLHELGHILDGVSSEQILLPSGRKAKPKTITLQGGARYVGTETQSLLVKTANEIKSDLGDSYPEFVRSVMGTRDVGHYVSMTTEFGAQLMSTFVMRRMRAASRSKKFLAAEAKAEVAVNTFWGKMLDKITGTLKEMSDVSPGVIQTLDVVAALTLGIRPNVKKGSKLATALLRQRDKFIKTATEDVKAGNLTSTMPRTKHEVDAAVEAQLKILLGGVKETEFTAPEFQAVLGQLMDQNGIKGVVEVLDDMDWASDELMQSLLDGHKAAEVIGKKIGEGVQPPRKVPSGKSEPITEPGPIVDPDTGNTTKPRKERLVKRPKPEPKPEPIRPKRVHPTKGGKIKPEPEPIAPDPIRVEAYDAARAEVDALSAQLTKTLSDLKKQEGKNSVATEITGTIEDTFVVIRVSDETGAPLTRGSKKVFELDLHGSSRNSIKLQARTKSAAIEEAQLIIRRNKRQKQADDVRAWREQQLARTEQDLSEEVATLNQARKAVRGKAEVGRAALERLADIPALRRLPVWQALKAALDDLEVKPTKAKARELKTPDGKVVGKKTKKDTSLTDEDIVVLDGRGEVISGRVDSDFVPPAKKIFNTGAQDVFFIYNKRTGEVTAPNQLMNQLDELTTRHDALTRRKNNADHGQQDPGAFDDVQKALDEAGITAEEAFGDVGVSPRILGNVLGTGDKVWNSLKTRAQSSVSGAMRFLGFDVYGNQAGMQSADGTIKPVVDAADGINRLGIETTRQQLRTGRFAKARLESWDIYHKWRKLNKMGFAKHLAGLAQEEFGEQITRHLGDPKMMSIPRRQLSDSDKLVRDAALLHQDHYRDILKWLKKNDPERWKDIPDNPNYVPRIFSTTKYQKLLLEFGEKNVTKLLSHALRLGNPKLNKENADKFAKMYLTKSGQAKSGMTWLNDPRTTRDPSKFADKLVKEFGIDPEQADEMAAFFAQSEKGPGRALHRIAMDETAHLELVGKSGQRNVDIRELFESNMFNLTDRYNWEVISSTLVAETIKRFNNKLGRPGLFTNLDDIKSFIVDDARARGLDVRHITEQLDMVIRTARGRGFQDSVKFGENASMFKDAVFSFGYGSTFGRAALSEVIPTLFGRGIANMLKANGVLRRVSTGEIPISRKDIKFMLEAQGMGLSARRFGKLDFMSQHLEEGMPGSNFAADARRLLKGATNITAELSGLNPITQWTEEMSMRINTYANVQAMLKGDVPNQARLSQMGITLDDWNAMTAQLRKHMRNTTGENGLDSLSLNLDEWDDQIVAAKFMNAMYSEVLANVTRGDRTDLPEWFAKSGLHRALGHILLQFRRFGISAHRNVLTRNVTAADGRAAMMFTTSAMGGLFTYMLSNLFAYEDSADGRRKLKERMSPTRLAIGAISRSPFSGTLMDVANPALSLTLGVDTYGNTHRYGLADSTFEQVPLFSWLGDIAGSGRAAIGIGTGQRDFEYHDWARTKRVFGWLKHPLLQPVVRQLEK